MSTLVRNNVNIFGAGTQPMVFSHGFGCDQNMWRLITPAFADDHRIVLFDHVGAGRSDLSAYVPAKYASLGGYADDVVEILEELDLTDVIFVGHSVSTMIGVLASLKAPERFAKLVMIGPSPRYIDDADYVGGFSREGVDELLDFLANNHLGWSAAMAPLIMANSDRPELSNELENSFCATDPDIASQFARVTFLSDNRADLPNVTIPSLILQSTEDVIAPQEVGTYCHQHLPNSTLVLLTATGHCAHISAPDATTAAIKDYLTH
ncbi:MAG: alpha/beta hydrolase [Pyrinomonadaceae bacterium]